MLDHLTSWFNSHLSTAPNEPTARIRVDQAQTGFFEGREFRTFAELDIPSGQSLVLRFTSLVDFILFAQNLSVDQGAIRLSAITGGASGGMWTALPVIGKNRMSSRRKYAGGYYQSQATIESGGTVTGGTVAEAVRVVAANSTAQQSTVGGSVADERGLPAGTYHLKLENISNGNAKGVYSLFWEERPV